MRVSQGVDTQDARVIIEYANIRLGLLKRWLPINHRKLPELLKIEFEAILPGRKQHDQRYIQHLIIRIFLYVRERSVAGKRIRRLLEIRVSYSEIAKKLHIKAMNMQTKAFCATVGLPFSRKFEDVLKDQKTRQTSLQAASYIAYACSNALGPDSKHRAARAVQVEMLVHSKQRRRFRRGTDGWVNLSTPRWSISKQSPSALDR